MGYYENVKVHWCHQYTTLAVHRTKPSSKGRTNVAYCYRKDAKKQITDRALLRKGCANSFARAAVRFTTISVHKHWGLTGECPVSGKYSVPCFLPYQPGTGAVTQKHVHNFQFRPIMITYPVHNTCQVEYNPVYDHVTYHSVPRHRMLHTSTTLL